MQIPRHIGVLLWLCTAVAAARTDPAALQLFVILSLFALIARNLGERREGPSAYSVFNAGCQPILGQINAEQFDNEIRHRPTEARNGLHPAGSEEDVLEAVRREILHEHRRGRRAVYTQTRPRRRR